ncbi:MAG: rhodanese-like domain-containing protein [Cytophagales bacterium]|nr:rhodanese-like domain-containing protein [Cytophagales bacterium]
MNEIDVRTFISWQREGRDFILLDVREKQEYVISNIGGRLVPLSVISSHIDNLPRDKTLVFHCRSGKRSAVAIRFLLDRGFEKRFLYNLKGGIEAYVRETQDTEGNLD